MTESEFLARFPKARKTGTGKYMSPCPAHEDRAPSLSIGIAPDGRILVHCHAGCEALSVVEAVGLTLSDLFPDRGIRDYMPGGFSRQERASRQNEEMIVAIAKADLAAGKRLSKVDQERLALAARRLKAREAA